MNASLSFTGSPTAAYRADMKGRSRPFGAHDAQWLAAAAQLHLAATATTQIPQRQHLLEALSLAIDIVGDEAIDRYVNREWFGRHAFHEALLVLADQIIDAEAYQLAGLVLQELLTAVPRLKPLERGRIMALRARIGWRTSDLDDARARYDDVARLGRESEEPELEARAALGLATVAQLRGNMPAILEHAPRAAEVASAIGHRSLERYAYIALMMGQAKTGDHVPAINSGWRIVELSAGNQAAEAEGLQNLGQLLLETGNATLARACFAAVLAREAAQATLLNALGGLARASSELRAESTVEWSMREVWRARETSAPRYPLCEALLECALALHELSRNDEAERYRAASHDMARSNGFHELEFRAQRLETKRRATTVASSSYANVVNAVQQLEPEQLPARVAFEAAPA